MKIDRGVVWCQVREDEDREIGWLDDYLSFENSAAYFQGRRGKDLRERMFRVASRVFPSGYCSMVEKAAKEAGFPVVVTDHRHPPTSVDPAADLSWLRDYQLAAVRRIHRKTVGIVKAPTGSGKTEIAIALPLSLPCRWLFLVHRATLVQQTADRFQQRTGVSAGTVVDGDYVPGTSGRLNVATFQAMWAGIKSGDTRLTSLLEHAEGLIVDECHVQSAASFLQVTNATKNAYFRVGLSGTPLARGDRRSILAVGALGPVIYSIEPKVLVAAGVLAQPKIRFIPVTVKSEAPTWQGVYGECVVRSTVRNAAVVKAAVEAARPTIVFVKEIGHGQRLQKLLVKAGVRAEFTWGTHSTECRQAAIQRLVRGDLDVLVCSVIFQEGVDIPSLASVVMASGGRSAIAALQQVGRGMRTDNGRKADFEVWEFLDEGNKLMERRARARMRTYEAEDYDVSVVGEPVQKALVS